VESVAWISERKDVLNAFFGLLALWTYARFVEETKSLNRRTKFFYGLTLLFFACSLMSKAMLVTFPFALLLLDFWPLQRFNFSTVRRLLLEKIPFFLLVLPVSIVAFIAQKNGRELVLNLPWSFRIETVTINYLRYVQKMFWPSDLSVLYPWPNSWPLIELFVAVIFVFGISVAVFVSRRSHPYLIIGWFWYLGTLVPVIGLIPLGAQSMANHYSYFPMIGILIALTWGIAVFFKQRIRFAVAPAAVASVAIVFCIWRVPTELVYWKNSATLWSRAIAVTQNNWGAHYCLGQILWNKDPNASQSEFQKSVDIYPGFADSQRALGGALALGGRFSEAVEHYKRAIVLEPKNSWGYNGAGTSLLKLNQVGDAIPFLLKAAEVDPAEGHKHNLVFALFQSGHNVEAMSNFLQAAESDPESFDRFLHSVETDTNQIELANNLAWAFATNPERKFRNGDYAVELATSACKMTGFKVTACIGTLAAAYAEAGRFDDAISASEKAIALAKQNGETDLLQKNQELLQQFRAHQPYHETSP
jgi:tetratricopeptide (TPR) repeat protein